MSERRGEPFKGVWPTIHESAWIHESAVVIGDVTIGPDVSIWPNVTLRGDEGKIVIGAGSNIQDGSTVHMTGGESDTLVGARVTVGHNCILHGCVIGDDVLVGMGSLIMDNARIGDGCYVGGGTLVTPNKVVEPGQFILGNPHRILRAVGERERGWIDYAWKHYVETARAYAARDAAK